MAYDLAVFSTMFLGGDHFCDCGLVIILDVPRDVLLIFSMTLSWLLVEAILFAIS